MTMEWSPKDAMKAYLQTLNLCKADITHAQKECYRIKGNRTLKNQQEDKNIIEPQGLELISALAAGNKARVLVEIISTPTKQGITPLTIALAVAAKQTGGKLICILPSHDHLKLSFRRIKEQLSLYGLDHSITHPDLENDHDHDHTRDCVVELRVGDGYEQIRDVKNIDFAVIDCKFDQSRLRLLCQKLHLNPTGAIIVANNILHRRQGVGLVDQVLKEKRGVESSVTTLPLGSDGVQVIIRIKSMVPPRRRHKRFLVTFDA